MTDNRILRPAPCASAISFGPLPSPAPIWRLTHLMCELCIALNVEPATPPNTCPPSSKPDSAIGAGPPAGIEGGPGPPPVVGGPGVVNPCPHETKFRVGVPFA